MTHAKAIFALGVAVLAMPFLGFPNTWENIIFFILGAGIAALSFRAMNHEAERNSGMYMHHKEGKTEETGEESNMSQRQNT